MSKMKKALCIACATAVIAVAGAGEAASFASTHESYNQEENRYTYEGTVRISIDGMSITCDKAIWKPDEKSLRANGNVNFKDKDATFRSVVLSMVEESGNLSLSGDGYFHVQGLTVTSGSISYDRENGRISFKEGVLVSTNGNKTLYNSAVYDIAARKFIELVN